MILAAFIAVRVYSDGDEPSLSPKTSCNALMRLGW
jgi:hypothetical protein